MVIVRVNSTPVVDGRGVDELTQSRDRVTLHLRRADAGRARAAAPQSATDVRLTRRDDSVAADSKQLLTCVGMALVSISGAPVRTKKDV
eukprot:gene22311-53024_t